MNNLGTKTLETNRLILRQFKMDDAQMFFDNWANDERVTKYLTWNPHKTVALTKQLLTEWINNYQYNNYYQWAIELKENKEVIGSISIVDMDEKNETVEVGYSLSYKYWNQGIMTESLKKVIEFFFNEVKIKKLIARHDSRNIASGCVMKKCGMKYIKSIEDVNKNENIILNYYEILNGSDS